MDERIEQVLSFWFGDAGEGEAWPNGLERWLGESPAFDRAAAQRFGDLVAKARSGELDEWAKTARGRLALVLLLDALPRRIFRESKEAFAGDEKALSLCLDGLDDELDKELAPLERAFFYMPAMHAEDADIQLTSVEIYGELAASAPPEHAELCRAFLRRAEKHRDLVERFDRFPQRNAVLGRPSTPEEAAFLQQQNEL